MKRLLFVVMLCIALPACGGSSNLTGTTTGVSQVVQNTATAIRSDTSTPTPVPTPTDAVTPTPSPTSTPVPTPTPAATPTPAQQKPTVSTSGFGQDDQFVAWAFIVDNPNSGFAIQDSQLQVAVYDANGTVIGTDRGSIGVILPQSKRPVVGTIVVPDGTTADHVDVQYLPGSYRPMTSGNVLSTSNVQFFGGVAPKVTGVVKNVLSQDLQTVLVNVIEYDDQGRIVGGGFGTVDFVPANGQSAAEIYVFGPAKPAKVEMYAIPTTFDGLE